MLIERRLPTFRISRMHLDIHKAFSSDYEIELISEWPSEHHGRLYFPGADPNGGHDGVMVSVSPHQGAQWTGVFGFGMGGTDGIYTCPNPLEICIVTEGASYIVNVRDPEVHRFRNLATSSVY